MVWFVNILAYFSTWRPEKLFIGRREKKQDRIFYASMLELFKYIYSKNSTTSARARKFQVGRFSLRLSGAGKGRGKEVTVESGFNPRRMCDRDATFHRSFSDPIEQSKQLLIDHHHSSPSAYGLMLIKPSFIDRLPHTHTRTHIARRPCILYGLFSFGRTSMFSWWRQCRH